MSLFKIEPTKAFSGEEAVEKVKESYSQGKLFKMIIMDINMPGIDGFTACKYIKEVVGDGTKVVAGSANSNTMVEGQATEAGMDGCIEKPMRI